MSSDSWRWWQKNINEDDERVQSLINCFRSLDVDHSGTLSRDQLLQGFESAGTPISGEDLDKLLANSSEESVKNGTIDFTLWLSSTLGRAALRADDHADATFHALNLHHEAELDSALFTGGEKEPAVVNKEAFRRRVKRLASRRCSVKKDRFPIVPKEAPAECEESRAVDIFTYPQERVPRRISGLRSF